MEPRFIRKMPSASLDMAHLTAHVLVYGATLGVLLAVDGEQNQDKAEQNQGRSTGHVNPHSLGIVGFCFDKPQAAGKSASSVCGACSPFGLVFALRLRLQVSAACAIAPVLFSLGLVSWFPRVVGCVHA